MLSEPVAFALKVNPGHHLGSSANVQICIETFGTLVSPKAAMFLKISTSLGNLKILTKLESFQNIQVAPMLAVPAFFSFYSRVCVSYQLIVTPI